MKRKLIAGMLGLAVAGCADLRSEIPKETKRPLGPVGITPIPPIDQTVNRGIGHPAVSQSTLRDPEDPRWSGRAPAPDATGTGSARVMSASLKVRPQRVPRDCSTVRRVRATVQTRGR